MKKYPPDTDALHVLAEFFDETDITELEGLELVGKKPQRQMIAVTVRLPKEDLDELKRRAKMLGLGYTSLIRAAVRRFVAKKL